MSRDVVESETTAFVGAAFLGVAFLGAVFFGVVFFGAALLGAGFFGSGFFLGVIFAFPHSVEPVSNSAGRVDHGPDIGTMNSTASSPVFPLGTTAPKVSSSRQRS